MYYDYGRIYRLNPEAYSQCLKIFSPDKKVESKISNSGLSKLNISANKKRTETKGANGGFFNGTV
jgi:hypothetical protein